jgi:hypothetical protein
MVCAVLVLGTHSGEKKVAIERASACHTARKLWSHTGKGEGLGFESKTKERRRGMNHGVDKAECHVEQSE